MTASTRSSSESTGRIATAGLIGLSAAASLFLIWLLYFHKASAGYAGRFTYLPALNAALNAMSAVSILTGFAFVKRRDIRSHKKAMLLAFVFSSLFLISYIVHHALHGDTRFPAIGGIRTIYLSLLASHVILSIVALPLVLITFFLSLTGRFRKHKAIARYTFPVWLYVSVTGVIVFAMLSAYAH